MAYTFFAKDIFLVNFFYLVFKCIFNKKKYYQHIYCIKTMKIFEKNTIVKEIRKNLKL